MVSYIYGFQEQLSDEAGSGVIRTAFFCYTYIPCASQAVRSKCASPGIGIWILVPVL